MSTSFWTPSQGGKSGGSPLRRSPRINRPKAIVDQWFTEQQRGRLRWFLDDTEVPDRLMTACCAWLEALGAAEAARLLHLHRSRPRPDFDRFTQTPEERAEDLRSVNAV